MSDFFKAIGSTIKTKYDQVVHSEGYKRFQSRAQDFGTCIGAVPLSVRDRIRGHSGGQFREHYVELKDRDVVWKEDSEGLYLLCHGLGSHPKAWDPVIHQLKQKHATADIVAPFIKDGGNCSNHEAAEPVLRLAQQYLKKHPQKPICIVGYSNGARIAAYLEARIPNETPVKVCSVAGPFFGAKIVESVKKFALLRKAYSQELLNELTPGSDIAHSLIMSMKRENSPNRWYSFFASKDDTVVDHETSKPVLDLGKGEKVFHYERTGHCSIVRVASKDIAKDTTDWMKERPWIPLIAVND